MGRQALRTHLPMTDEHLIVFRRFRAHQRMRFHPRPVRWLGPRGRSAACTSSSDRGGPPHCRQRASQSAAPVRTCTTYAPSTSPAMRGCVEHRWRCTAGLVVESLAALWIELLHDLIEAADTQACSRVTGSGHLGHTRLPEACAQVSVRGSRFRV